MTDLNVYLMEEQTQAISAGRPPCFFTSPTLATCVNQVHTNGTIAHSAMDGQDFLDFVDAIGLQFHPFNTAKTAAINAADYDLLDPQQKYLLGMIFDEVVGEPTLIVGDSRGVNRLFVGPVSSFHQIDYQNGTTSLSAGHLPVIPNWELPKGYTWAQSAPYLDNRVMMPITVANSTPEPQVQEETKPMHIPRPPNPFIIYRAAHHKTVADAHPDLSNNEISKKIGRQWQNESNAKRELYRKKAAEIKAAFMAAHPDYKYSPRKSSEVKRRKKATAETTGAAIVEGDFVEIGNKGSVESSVELVTESESSAEE